MRTISILLAAALAGCTAVTVKPAAWTPDVPRTICVKKNATIVDPDLLPAVEAGLRRSGLAFTVYDGPPYTAEPAETLAPPQTFPSTCDYVLTYSGTMWWDLAMYLNHAEFRIQDRSYREVGFATWHLKGHGGFDLGKYSSTDSKVAPVLAELLGGVPS
ncbi:MAG: hypothetical protein U0842_23305 [Candidatus Binatia bacterium]